MKNVFLVLFDLTILYQTIFYKTGKYNLDISNNKYLYCFYDDKKVSRKLNK